MTVSAGSQFTDGLAKLKPGVSTELLLLLSLSSSLAELNVGTIAPFAVQNSRLFSQPWPMLFLIKLVFLLTFGM